MNTKTRVGTILGAACLVAVATPALAYVGPGAGVSLIGSVIGLLLTLGTAVWVIVFWPLRAMLRRKKKPASLEPERESDPVGEQTTSSAASSVK